MHELNAASRRAILNVALKFIKQNKPFTSVEIANEIKRKRLWIRNRDVASLLRTNVIGSNISNGPYCATLITVDAGKSMEKTYLYHPDGFNPDDYLNRDLKAITPEEFEKMHNQPKQPVSTKDTTFNFPKP